MPERERGAGSTGKGREWKRERARPVSGPDEALGSVGARLLSIKEVAETVFEVSQCQAEPFKSERTTIARSGNNNNDRSLSFLFRSLQLSNWEREKSKKSKT